MDKPVSQSIQQKLDVARRLFKIFDLDQNGYITDNEVPNALKETYKQIGVDYSPTPYDIK